MCSNVRFGAGIVQGHKNIKVRKGAGVIFVRLSRAVGFRHIKKNPVYNADSVNIFIFLPAVDNCINVYIIALNNK